MPPSDDSGTDEEEPSFPDLLQSFSRQWLHAQLTHHVSLSAAGEFWKIAMKCIPNMMEQKAADNIKHKIPQFQQVFQLNNNTIFYSVKLKSLFFYISKGAKKHIRRHLSRCQDVICFPEQGGRVDYHGQRGPHTYKYVSKRSKV